MIQPFLWSIWSDQLTFSGNLIFHCENLARFAPIKLKIVKGQPLSYQIHKFPFRHISFGFYLHRSVTKYVKCVKSLQIICSMVFDHFKWISFYGIKWIKWLFLSSKRNMTQCIEEMCKLLRNLRFLLQVILVDESFKFTQSS